MPTPSIVNAASSATPQSFKPETFRSAGWCLNGHMHTICSSFFSSTEKPPVRRRRLDTPDGDFMEVDVSLQQNDMPLVVIFHGLEGSTDRFYITQLMMELHRRNYSFVGINFRGCGPTINRNPRFYHAGDSPELRTIFKWVIDEFGTERQIFAAGYSLGGNVLIKYLGEQGGDTPVEAAVSISAPYDLALGSVVVGKGFNKVYQARFMRYLKAKLEAKRKTHPAEMPQFTGTTLYDFDEQITAPLHGFASAEAYYSHSSSGQYISGVKTPLLIIHSEADPFCPVQALPVKSVRDNPFTQAHIVKRGGHVGFWSSPYGWLSSTVADFFDHMR